MKTYELTIKGKAYKVDIDKFDGKRALVKVDGTPYKVDVEKASEAAFSGAAGPALSSTQTQEARKRHLNPPWLMLPLLLRAVR